MEYALSLNIFYCKTKHSPPTVAVTFAACNKTAKLARVTLITQKAIKGITGESQ